MQSGLKRNLILSYVFFAVILTGCGYYSFKGALPSNITKIAIPLFEDRTSYPDARETLTNDVVNTFIEDGTLQIVQEGDADLILYGSINSIRQQEANVEAGEITTNYKMIVSVKIKVEDIPNSKTLVEKTISQYGLMSATGGLDERNTAISEALELITDEILNVTLGGW